ncbi:MAG: hypothetical protein WD768_06095 [Phycisphaeraceae bacterium]
MSSLKWSVQWCVTLMLILPLFTGCEACREKEGEGWTKAVDDPKADATAKADTPAATEGGVKGLDLIPLKERSIRIEFTEGELKGMTVDVKIAEGEKGQWVETAKDARILYYGDSDGSVVMGREEDFGEKVTITYEPAFVLMPKTLEAGKPFEGTTKMTVLNRGSGTKKAGGTCKYKVELVRQEKVTTPAGEFDAYLIQTTRDISLDLASVQVTVLTWHVPGQGMVASKVNQKTQALGLFGSEKVEAWKLAK